MGLWRALAYPYGMCRILETAPDVALLAAPLTAPVTPETAPCFAALPTPPAAPAAAPPTPEEVPPGRAAADLVVHQVVEFQDVDVSDRDRIVVGLAGPSVEQLALAVVGHLDGAVDAAAPGVAPAAPPPVIVISASGPVSCE